MPNLEYYYDEYGVLNDSILNEIGDKDIVDVDGNTIGNEYTVVFRDEYGKLKKRKPVSSDRNLGQFVYIPSNFTISRNISNAFNFRYNLPKCWEMPNKPNGHVGYYKSTKEFNEGINNDFNLSYRTQYYFLTDKSVNWNDLYNASSPFISSGQDVDYIHNKARVYYDDNEISSETKNVWMDSEEKDIPPSTPNNWRILQEDIIKNFYMDLNLCGKKNIYNMIEDNGCPINIENKEVILSNFVSDILTIFLNGRVFDENFEVNDLTPSKHGSGNIINYYGFGKNIILPKLVGSTYSSGISIIPINNDFVYYDFMVDNYNEISIKNYETYLNNDKQLFIRDKNKYTFKT
jgi:hypothetical protein